MTIQQAQLTAKKMAAKMALESLINQCYREIRCLEQYSDIRMLIATADVQHQFERAIEAADDLEDAFNEVENAEGEAA